MAINQKVFYVHINFFKDFIYFIFRERRREGEQHHWYDRETSIGCLLHVLQRDQTCNPGMCPDCASNQWPFPLWDGAQLSHITKGSVCFLKYVGTRYLIQYIFINKEIVFTQIWCDNPHGRDEETEDQIALHPHQHHPFQKMTKPAFSSWCVMVLTPTLPSLCFLFFLFFLSNLQTS